jgi:hypothetical protein
MFAAPSESGVAMVLWIDSEAHGYVEYSIPLSTATSALCTGGSSVTGIATRAHFATLLEAPYLTATVALKALAKDYCYPYLRRRGLLAVAPPPLRVLHFEGVSIAFDEHFMPTRVLVTERRQELALETAQFFAAVQEGRFGDLDSIFAK